MVERTAEGALHPYVMDFGLARQADSADYSRTGVIEGTPRYMAPEQARGDTRHLDRRTDVYALGVTLYELLTGQSPYSGSSEVDILVAILAEESRPLRDIDKSIPRDIEAVTLKCLEKEPEARYDSAKALAEDLRRYLDAEPVTARRGGPVYRLYRRARKHRLLAGLCAALLTTLLVFLVDVVRTRLAARERERQAQVQTQLARELGQRLGQEIKDMEWTLRSARQLPLHDLGREKRIVYQHMEQLRAELSAHGEAGQALAHYAIGRGHLALHEYPQALSHLQQSINQGNRDAEVHYALGFALGKHFEQALHEARLSGGGDWAKKQSKELEPRYLVPAIAALKRSQELRRTPNSYLAGLIAYYQRAYQLALKQADAALRETPWLYEAWMLAGDVHLEWALAARDRGAYSDASREFAQAVEKYGQAATVGPSDAQVYEGLAEAWVRQIEMNADRGQPSDDAYEAAMAATEKLLLADPQSTEGLLKKAFAAQMTMALTGAGLANERRAAECLKSAEAVLAREPGNPYASDLSAVCYANAAEAAQGKGQNPEPLLRTGLLRLEPVIRRHPHFLWGINDLAVIYATVGDYLAAHGDRGASEALEKSLEYYTKAQTLDPTYAKAFANALSSDGSLIAISPSKAAVAALLSQADATLSQCLSLNSQNANCHNNYAISYTLAARRFHVAGDDTDMQGALMRARHHFELCRKAGGNYLDSEQHSALMHVIEATALVQRDSDPSTALRDARAAIGRCFEQASDDVMCSTLSVQADFVAADWKIKRHADGRLLLTAALAKAARIARQATISPDAQQTLAEAHLRLARAESAAGPALELRVRSGLGSLEKAFLINPRHGRSRQTQGELLLLAAERSRNEAARQASARAAITAFEAAIASDALLTRRITPLIGRAQALEARR